MTRATRPRRSSTVYMTPRLGRALDWLRDQPGGFSLSNFVKSSVIAYAKSRGWVDRRNRPDDIAIRAAEEEE